MEADLGKPFADFIIKIITVQSRHLHPHVQILQTQRVADKGKDIIVSSK